jgi:hypothetical protein
MRHANNGGFTGTKERREVLHRNSLRLLAKISDLVISGTQRSQVSRSNLVVDQGSVRFGAQNEAFRKV